MSKQILLDEWQKRILEQKGHIVLCTGRQVGKTTIMAMKAGQYMLNNPNSKIIIVSLTEDQAKLIIVMILDYLENVNKKMVARGKHKPTQNKIVLTNKSQAIARPVGNTGDAVRGFTGNVLIIDEASRMPELVWTAGRPTLLTTAGEIWMCSTPAGRQGYFWEAFQNKNEKYKVFHISSEEVIKERVISESWTERQRAEAIAFLEGEKKDMSQLQYGQEYLGLFLEELQRFFEDELIRTSCILERRGSVIKGKDYFMGCDIARLGGDQSTFEILERKRKDYFEQVENQTMVRIPTTTTEDRILQLDRIYNLKKIYIDCGSGSLGVGIYDQLVKNSQTSHKIEAINNRAISLERDGSKKQRLMKEDLYNNLKSMMEKGYIKLLNDPELISSLVSVQYEIQENGNMKVFGNYTHIVEGIIRAAYAHKEKFNNLFISYM